MLLSVFTPTHKPRFIQDAYRSLLAQGYQNWEWLLVPNGECKVDSFKAKHAAIAKDPRVKVLSGGSDLHNIGALKRFACNAAEGDAFIELDHDDLLVPGRTLETIADCFKAGAGFVYSDAAVFRYRREHDRHHFNQFTYSGSHGWEHYPIKIYGRELLATRAFDVSPRSLCEIFYAPDHVRCWSRSTYHKAGGHNPDLSVCDDHELMIKSYLTGDRFQHTGGCNYLYRNFSANTVHVRSKKIQNITRTLKEKYFGRLVDQWTKTHGHQKLDIRDLQSRGWSADKHLKQHLGYDQYGSIVADGVLQAWEPAQVRDFMNAAYVALVPGGSLTVTVPEVHTGMGYGDVEWKSHFSAQSMLPYTRKQFARDNGNITCRFQLADVVEVFPSSWHKQHEFKYLRFELIALKGQRHPALQHI